VSVPRTDRCSGRLRPLPVLAILLLIAAAPALRAQNACLGIALTGAAGHTIFDDGFESGDTSAWTAPVEASFSISGTVDLGVEVTLDPATAGDHLLELRWYLPGDGLYQSVAVPFSNAARAPSTRRVAGYPFPVPTRRARLANTSGPGHAPVLAVDDRLPVAGTSIVAAGLDGEWHVAAFLDGQEDPCTAPVGFRLER
jgi:hypothetical protein